MIPSPDKIARILETGGEPALCEVSGLMAPAVVAELADGATAEGLHYCSASLTLFEATAVPTTNQSDNDASSTLSTKVDKAPDPAPAPVNPVVAAAIAQKAAK